MDSKNTKILHFTFTPVQSFVSQARRTRDLWSGSYLLSWLVGHAMVLVENHQENIIIPDISNDELIKAIKSRKSDSDQKESVSEQAKQIGSLPNRFTVKIPNDIDPKIFAEEIKEQWKNLAKVVKNKIDPDGTAIDPTFWNRQIDNLWEFSWVMGEIGDGHLLDSRKNLRIPNGHEQAGDKCTVCGERQDLSESHTPSKPPNRQASREWWQQRKRQIKKIDGTNLDLNPNERLCAVCLVKRVFPLIAKEPVGSEKKVIGWDVDKNYPSTPYLSAIDWLQDVLKQAQNSKEISDAANALVKKAQEHVDYYNSEANTRILGYLKKVMKDSGVNSEFIELDGNLFFDTAIASDQLYGKVEKNSQESIGLTSTAKFEMTKALSRLQTAVKSKATPFYAILLMDGDNMGTLLSNREHSQTISSALSDFTGRVNELVQNHNGRLVYAGGDDVFALLPVSQAIACAAACQAAYRKAFAGTNLPNEIKQAATISAAVQFAHMRVALGVVVRDGHKLLDDVAKDQSGRDALACRVWKPGGPVLTWTRKWGEVCAVSGKPQALALLDQVLCDYAPQASTSCPPAKSPSTDNAGDAPKAPKPLLSSGLFYKLRHWFEQANAGLIDHELLEDLIWVEALANREIDTSDERKPAIWQAVQRLLELCKETRDDQAYYNADAAMLVRFLVQKEV